MAVRWGGEETRRTVDARGGRRPPTDLMIIRLVTPTSRTVSAPGNAGWPPRRGVTVVGEGGQGVRGRAGHACAG
jgi:hypothetical protein